MGDSRGDVRPDFDAKQYRCAPFDGTPGLSFDLFVRDFCDAFSRDFIGDSDIISCMYVRPQDICGFAEQNNVDRALFGGAPPTPIFNADGRFIDDSARALHRDHMKRKRVLYSHLIGHITHLELQPQRHGLHSWGLFMLYDGPHAFQL
eukprot:scaffold303735_cov28-Tisochrysis_lutea.AAC.1